MNEHNEKKKTPTYEWIPRINSNALIVFRTRLWKFSISAVNWLSSRLHLPFATYRTGRTVPCACWWTECHIPTKNISETKFIAISKICKVTQCLAKPDSSQQEHENQAFGYFLSFFCAKKHKINFNKNLIID